MQSEKPNVIFVLGGPGSGKGTQCENFVAKYPGKFKHLSTGDLLREAAKVPSEEHAEVIKCMKEGKMVPSKPLVQLIKEEVIKGGNEPIYVLDGFPRNSDNLIAWKEVIGDDFNVKYLLYFECTEEELRKRLLKRAQKSGRADDNPQTIEKRLKTFHAETEPMLKLFKQKGYKLVSINANQSVEKIGQDVETEVAKL